MLVATLRMVTYPGLTGTMVKVRADCNSKAAVQNGIMRVYSDSHAIDQLYRGVKEGK